MSVRVRRARREDAATVIDLIEELARFEDLDPPDAAARERLIADGWGATPRFEAWLAECDGRAVGCATFYELYSTFKARPILFIEDIFVMPEFRGQGIGYALYRLGADLAVQRGCCRMEWLCLDWNTAAQTFYERLGAARIPDWFSYRLLPEQVPQLPPLADGIVIELGR